MRRMHCVCDLIHETFDATFLLALSEVLLDIVIISGTWSSASILWIGPVLRVSRGVGTVFCGICDVAPNAIVCDSSIGHCRSLGCRPMEGPEIQYDFVLKTTDGYSDPDLNNMRAVEKQRSGV